MSILDLLSDQLSGEPTARIGQQLGVDEASASTAVSAALPVLMTALAGNASRQGGVESLAGALDRDHDGSILDDLAGFLGNPDTANGDGILRHTLGGQRGAVEQELGRQTGLDLGAVTKLLPILAPIVMGALGRAKRQDSLDVGGLTSMLAGERQRAERGSSASLGAFAALLDTNADGAVTDDVAKAGMNLLGKFLRRRR
ncbi:MAG TPA: DUF937 domain-containing protein [Gemmatimonadota bacterium]|nr:DUF937 domain-containing protein [Gemmatimonadota bacterium]